MFVRESKLDDSKDAGEHSHGLLHLSEAVDLALFQRAASRDVDAKFQLNDGEAGIRWRLRYLQKQRDGQAEGWLKLHQVRRHRRERPAPLVGPRWSPTRGLKALVEADAERPRFYPVRLPAEASAPPALRLVVNALVADPLQLPLFPE